MSSTGFNAESSAMTRAINGFETCAENVQSAMAKLESDLQDQLNSNTYQGAQAQAFTNVSTKIQEDMQTASTQIQNMSQLMQTAFKNYLQGDQEAQQELNKIGNQAGSFSQSLNPTISRLSGSN
jgi:uncharacterized membrane-anchored protein YjiN (DUF445 family)